jgi:hypothetical protein
MSLINAARDSSYGGCLYTETAVVALKDSLGAINADAETALSTYVTTNFE